MKNNMKFELNQKIDVLVDGNVEKCVIVRTIYETSCVPSEAEESRSYWVKVADYKIHEISESNLIKRIVT